MTVTRKNILITLAGVAGALLLAVAFWPKTVAVQTALVDRGEVRVEVVEEARTRMSEVYVLSAALPGRLLRVAVEPGDRVRAGEPLARLTSAAASFLEPRFDAEVRALVAAAEAKERASAAERELVERELQRIRRLHEDGMVADAVREASEAKLISVRAAEQVAIAELRRARAQLLAAGRESGGDSVLVESPVDGVVLQVLQESETVVAAGAPLLVIGDPSNIEVVAELLSQDAVRLAPDAEAQLENWGGIPLAARVVKIEPAARTKVSALGIEEQRTNVILRFLEPPPAVLRRHDFRVDARIVAEQEEALRVPLAALVREGADWVIYAVRGARAERTVVGVRRLGEGYAALEETGTGLQPGARVVLYPSKAVIAGGRLAISP